MTANEVGFVNNIVNVDKYIDNIIEHIEEEFGVKAQYDKENNILHLNESDSIKISSAKNYILSKIDEDFINITI